MKTWVYRQKKKKKTPQVYRTWPALRHPNVVQGRFKDALKGYKGAIFRVDKSKEKEKKVNGKKRRHEAETRQGMGRSNLTVLST